MKNIFLLIMITFSAVNLYADIKVVAVKGTVSVRHGVQEQWIPVSVGDVLKPEDSMELRKKSSATILIDNKLRITIPESVIIDFSDLQNLTQKELLLKLAMEQVRSVPSKENGDEMIIPRITTIHGDNKQGVSMPGRKNIETGSMQLNGTKVLYDNGFYATCVLKAKEVFRSYPELTDKSDMRLMIAAALEKMNLGNEALNEYMSITTEQLSQTQRLIVAQKIESLKKDYRK